MKKEDLFYYLALQSVEGIGPVNARKLIEHCGGVQNIFRPDRRELKLIKGISERIINQIGSVKVYKNAERELKYIEKQNIDTSSIEDKSYPSALRNCYDAPILLFKQGKFDLGKRRIISIVGTRKMTGYGKEFLANFVQSIKKYNPIIVSGLAYGVDSCAHQESIRNNLCTIGILAHGLDRIYPRSHYKLAEKMKENGGLYTEFWSGSAPEKSNFVKRNRIIAGLSEATIVIESADRGGSLITADLAASYNRDVFAVPGRVKDLKSKGCNMLIKTHRAAIIESGDDLEYLLGWSADKDAQKVLRNELFTKLDAKEKMICEYLKLNEKIQLDQLSIKTGLSVQSTVTLLLQLELKGLVKSLPGKKYQLS
ncbi:DNA-processing protein DprA [Lutimonas sp.]|uniref:DNA-processing protein DprA n=1 Tax=Lutimonas sp. TaxID=1872403 RepID=UPI003D9BD6E8